MADQEDPTQDNPFDLSKAMGSMGDRFNGLKKQWDQYLQDPAAQTATMQFAINMMQPPSFGDTGMARIGRALGSAGEAVGRREEMERKDVEAEAKTQTAEARSRAAETAAGRAADRAFYEQQRLGQFGETEARKKETSQLQATVKANVIYQRYVKEVLDRNAAMEADWTDVIKSATRPKGAVKPTPERLMPPEEFFSSPLGQHLMQGIGLQPKAAIPPGQAQGSVPAPNAPTTSQTKPPTASPTLAGRPSTGVIDVKTPADIDNLGNNQQYRRPDGVIKTTPPDWVEQVRARRPGATNAQGQKYEDY